MSAAPRLAKDALAEVRSYGLRRIFAVWNPKVACFCARAERPLGPNEAKLYRGEGATPELALVDLLNVVQREVARA